MSMFHTIMLASAAPEIRMSVYVAADPWGTVLVVSVEEASLTQTTALTKSECPRYRRPGRRVATSQLQMDLSQQPANRVVPAEAGVVAAEDGEKARDVSGAKGPR